MKIIRSLRYFNIKSNSSVTIGNFDGVHLAHQNIIKKVVNTANENNLKSIIVTFEPYPQFFFNKNESQNIVKISSFKEKYKILESLGVDYLIILKFNENFSKIIAHDFIKDILVNKLKTKFLYIGDDFCFGYKRQGSYKLLESQAKKYEFNLTKINKLDYKEIRISSTNVRELLNKGNIKLSQKLLGRNFGVFGKVVRGLGLGHKLGFPTANIRIKDKKVIKLSGIFAVKVKINNNVEFGVASWGIRPTVVSTGDSVLEVYIFDYSQNLYGKEVYIEFVDKIRDEIKFSNLEELTENIKNDVKKAKDILGSKENIKEII